MIRLSIVIPAYNESENLKKGILKNVEAYLIKQNYTYEVLIVDDGSIDKTADIIKKQIKALKNFRLIQNPHGGKAMAVITGFLKSNGELALFADMDQATPIEEIEKILPKFEEGFDVVIGSRSGRKGAPLIRKLMAFGFATLRNLILGLSFKDTQCGFKAFNRESINKIFPDLLKKWQTMKAGGAAVNAGFDVETLFIAKKKGFKICEVEVLWHHVGSERVQMIRDSLEAVKDILRIKINDLRGKYNR